MNINSGTVLVFKIGEKEKRCVVSAVNGKLVKVFEEGGVYKQMPMDNLMELIDKGYVEVYVEETKTIGL